MVVYRHGTGSHFEEHLLNVNISMTVDGFLQKYISLYIYLGLFFENRKNSGLTPGQNDECGQCHVDSRINEAEHRLGLLSVIGLLIFQLCLPLVWNLCPDGNMHGIIYRHIGRTGLSILQCFDAVGWVAGRASGL